MTPLIWRDERGNISVITVIALSALTGVAGLATIFIQSENARTAIQASLDGAVLAATALKTGTPDGRRIAVAKQTFEFNLQEATKSGNVEFTITEKPKFLVKQTEVTGSAKGTVTNSLGVALGITQMAVSTTATAKKISSEPLCLLALNRSQPAGIEIYGNAQINAHDCPVQANSEDGEGLQLHGNQSSASASMFGVTGGFTGDKWTPQPTTGTEPIDDPFASLPVPEPDTCVDVAAKLKTSSFVLNPGTYCGGLAIGAGATVTLHPGIYIMKDGQFSVGSGASVVGEDLMIALVGADARLDLKSDSSVKLTSPLGGTYKNIQFMSDRDLSASKFEQEWSTILSGATLEYDGVMYLPEQQLWCSGTGHGIIVQANSPSIAMVADKVWAQGNVKLDITQEDRRGLGDLTQAPGIAYGAMLAN